MKFSNLKISVNDTTPVSHLHLWSDCTKMHEQNFVQQDRTKKKRKKIKDARYLK